jgi:hypothetical protein
MSQAGFGQILYPPAPFPVLLPTTIGAGLNWNSGLLFNDGYRNMTVGVLMTQAGTLAIQQYIDLAGTMARPVNSTAIVASTLLIVDIPTTAATIPPPPFASFTIQITNSSGVTATLTNFQAILSAG